MKSKKEENKYKFYISFAYTQEETYGFCNCIMNIPNEQFTVEDLEDITNTIAKDNNYSSVIILNFMQLAQ
jgi:hypothetical protein